MNFTPQFSFARTLALSAALGFGFTSPASAQTSVTTVPVGAVTLTFPQGNSCHSITLEDNQAYVGTVASVTPNSISVSTSTLTNGAYATAAAPYVLRLSSGALAGSTFQITANDTVSLTLNTNNLDISTLVTANDKFGILPVDTLGTLFGTTTVPLQTGSSATTADNIMIWSGTAWFTYYHNGTNWRRSGSLANQNNTVLSPDFGFMVIRRAIEPLSLVLTGRVRNEAARLSITGGASTFIGNAYPVDQKLSTLPFASMSGWAKASSATSADKVLVWSGSAWLTFYNNGSNWKMSGSLANQNDYIIKSGTPLYVIRGSLVAASESFASFNLPYTL